MLTSERVQQYVRIALYTIFGALAKEGVTVPDNWKTFAVAVAGLLATLAWTAYGTRLNALISQISKSPDVQTVLATPAIAAAVPSDKVIASSTAPAS